MNRLHHWIRRPVVIPRGAVVIVNGLFVLLGVVLTLAGAPPIHEVTGREYLFMYGLGIALASGVALVGSTSSRPKFEIAEGIGALIVFSLLTVYVAATAVPALNGDLGKAALAVIVIIASVLSATRGFAIILSAIGRKEPTHHDQ